MIPMSLLSVNDLNVASTTETSVSIQMMNKKLMNND